MQIGCPACKTKITVPDEKIKPEGTKVKCGKCSKIFTVKKKSTEKAAPEKAAAAADDDDLFGPPATAAPAPAPPPAAPAAAPAFDAAAELGLGQSSAPVDDDYLGGDNFGAEMDNYKTQIRQVSSRDSSMFGSSDDLDGKAAKREDTAGLFDTDQAPKPRTQPPPAKADLDSLFDEPAAPAPNKPAPAMPAKESLDDLFGKGLDDPADELADKLREAKPKKGREDIDALFDRGEPEPKASNAERDAFFDDEPAPAPPPRREAPPAPKGPSAEELAATMKLEPALKEEDIPKPPPPRPAEAQPAAQAKKRAFPVKALALGVGGLLVAGGIGAAVLVPAINKPLMAAAAPLFDYVDRMLASKPATPTGAPITLAVTVTGGRAVVGGRGDKLYVIEGRVRNDYPGARSFIKLRGKLIGADGAALASREVFAGNLLNDEEIRGLDRVKIDGILNRSVGGGLQNFNVPAGSEIPFQIVFYDVEQPVSQQQVEPIGSEPGS